MSKTEEVLKLMNEGETDTKVIKEKTGASEALITRCRQKLKKPEIEKKEEEEEAEPTDEEIEAIITKIKIEPDKKYLTKDKEDKKENYRCMGCGNEWESNSIPLSCPKCGSEF
jgi:rubrerythrin